MQREKVIIEINKMRKEFEHEKKDVRKN